MKNFEEKNEQTVLVKRFMLCMILVKTILVLTFLWHEVLDELEQFYERRMENGYEYILDLNQNMSLDGSLRL